MNSVTMVSALRMNKSMTLKAPQNRPKRSRISLAWPDAGDRAEAKHHLLVHVENRDEEQQSPEEVRPVVLAGLGVGAEGSCVVVADHHDQAGADDGEERLQLGRHPWPCCDVAAGDGPERTADVADVLGIEDGGVVEGVSSSSSAAPPDHMTGRPVAQPPERTDEPLGLRHGPPRHAGKRGGVVSEHENSLRVEIGRRVARRGDAGEGRLEHVAAVPGWARPPERQGVVLRSLRAARVPPTDQVLSWVTEEGSVESTRRRSPGTGRF